MPAAIATVRPMTDDDDLGSLNAGNPLGWMSVAWDEMARESEGLEMHRFVGLLDDRPLGFAFAIPQPMAAGGLGFGAVHVLPEGRRQGLGSALRGAVEDTVRGRLPGVMYCLAEDDADAAAAVGSWGLRESARHSESFLDLVAIDRDRFASYAARDGVTIAPLDVSDEEGWRELHGYMQERFLEAPDSADGGGFFPYDVFRSVVREPWMLMTAERDGRHIGITFVLNRPGDDTATNTMFTGVSPEARGLGVAIALKAQHALLMADHGKTRLYTQNMAGNVPILAANATLGFVRDSGYIDVEVALVG